MNTLDLIDTIAHNPVHVIDNSIHDYYEPLDHSEFKTDMSAELSHDYKLIAYVFMNDRDSYVNDEIISKVIQKVCANPYIITIDFSELRLIDTDLIDVFEGLYQREINTINTPAPCGLQFINLCSENITPNGILSFLMQCQKGKKSNSLKKKIVPDLRNTFFRVGFIIEDDFLEQLQSVAPSVFAGGFRIVH